MAPSLHIAATEQEASRSAPVATLDEVLHRQLFDRSLLDANECPVLRRMSGASDDVAFATEELEALASEAACLMPRASPMLARQLGQIANAAREAQRAGGLLFVIAD